jgi:hypothetical protein
VSAAVRLAGHSEPVITRTHAAAGAGVVTPAT